MKNKAYIVPILIICLFAIHTSLMFYEYANYNGFDVFRLRALVDCRFFVCTGDLTTWINHQPTTLNYRTYGLMGLVGAILSFIDYRVRKQKISLWTLALWTTAFLSYAVPVLVLSGQKYGLTLMLYYQGFLTMQFLQFKNLALSIAYIAYIALFLMYTIIFIRQIQRKVKISE